jgi:uncharacterized protein (DUF1697 family)
VPTHAAFLRAVNLGGRRRASGSELCEVFAGLGYGEVAAFRASGNVVFAARGAERRLQAEIERALGQRFGFEIDVYLRTAAQLGAVCAHPLNRGAPGTTLQVALLKRLPHARVREEAKSLAGDRDRLDFGRRELLWLSYGNSELNLRALEKLIGPWTMRTMATLEQLLERHFGS